MPLKLDYFYGGEAEQYSFYRIPKVLFTDQNYSSMTMEARVLYGLLLDRMGLSARNGWLDSCGRVFIYFTLEDAMTQMGFGHNKAVRHFKELEDANMMTVKEYLRQMNASPEERKEVLAWVREGNDFMTNGDCRFVNDVLQNKKKKKGCP